jgi:isopentenyl diphosphate isomerase/L-lactate dehydrogenase-like FMN-dependent dehydrogenase
MAASHSPSAVNIADLRELARRRLPRVVFDYVDGGAEDEVTLRENARAFASVAFRPRQCVPVRECELSTTVLGEKLAIPAVLAPVGYSRMFHPDGECGAAREAGRAGTAYTLSTISGHRLEDVKASTTGPAWFQLYLVGGREAAENVIERAQKAGFSRLVVTVDTPVAGLRERDYRNGMTQLVGGNLWDSIPFLPELLTHTGWLVSFLRDGGVPELPNIVIPGKGAMPLTDVASALSQTAVTWSDFDWIRRLWKGPIIVKGILTGDDARKAVDRGAAAVVVSNHGGRQLDYAPATLRALPEIVAAVGGHTEVLMDGGIRRGSDIIKALCLGARAVLLGRAYAYGLAAAGEAGVARAIQIIRADLDRTLKLLGCASIADLDASYLAGPDSFGLRVAF